MGVDVSICAVTFRRPEGLARLLASLARQKLPPGLRAELVLVDNDPQGGAFGAARRVEQASVLPVRFFHEGASNISLGRNRCIDEAQGSWIAMIDDDETAHESWIAAYAWLSEHVEADGFFGPVIPRLEVARESWLDPTAYFARRRFPTGTTLGTAGAFTSNAFVRRALLRELRFDPAFGRSGGEDSDCFARARLRGARFVWCDEACVDEWIPPSRHRPGFLTQRALEKGASWSRIQRSARPRWLRLLRATGRIAAGALALPCAAAFGRRRAFAAWLRLCTQIGRLYGLLGGQLTRRAG